MTKSVEVLHTGEREYVSAHRKTLMRVMHQDLAKYKTPAVLAHREDTDHGSRFVFEGKDVTAPDFYKEYRLYPIPVYRGTKGGTAA